MVAVVFADTLFPELVGERSPAVYRAFAIRPEEEKLRFFAQLEELGDTGPLVELPSRGWSKTREARRQLLQAYHHRPVSSCYNSVIAPGRKHVEQLVDRLPEPEAILALRELGFRTLVVHRAGAARQRLEQAARESELLEPLHASDSMAAFRIAP